MTNIAIRAENLGKLYLREEQRRSRVSRQADAEGISAPFRDFAPLTRRRSRTASSPQRNHSIWALRHVSIEIERGDLVGIVGDNGGGKTTLLRILSRISHPTEGHAEIRGRVGTLLDIGAGFHGDLTGRENVYLRGRILGMTGGEIKRKLDEIVAFAELEEVIDTPLKRYSSGMCVRLAFAVAAHQESEVLLVDEVLALVDATFEKKCVEKMMAAGREGRTVLFVSHELEFIRQLCRRGIVFAHGRVVYSGPASEAVDYYSSVSNPQQRNEPSAIREALRGI
jgi:lipopolysaccharide transport system ATP-binding protein